MTRPIGEILHRQQSRILIGIAATGLVVGGLLYWFAQPVEAGWVWSAATAPVLLGLFVQIVISLRKGDIGLDIVAALSMSAALAFGEPLAANVVAMMYAGGQLLEDFAQGRAKREMKALMGRVAQTAMRFEGDALQQVLIADSFSFARATSCLSMAAWRVLSPCSTCRLSRANPFRRTS
ncbi:hypothetical protein BLJAPNOD_06945 [Ensifer sp. M14]|uniref:hypothetical protein n=1 Tax=Ensifer sp. M14 TaxID=2203782 RepID=UPI000E2AD5F8|nr:hypothetical protein BLJAPNOD_06945 [Ensifer sp. M14]